MRAVHFEMKKALDNVQIKKKTRDDAVKAFYATLKLLRVWNIYIKKFGFPKSARDHRYTRQ